MIFRKPPFVPSQVSPMIACQQGNPLIRQFVIPLAPLAPWLLAYLSKCAISAVTHRYCVL